MNRYSIPGPPFYARLVNGREVHIEDVSNGLYVTRGSGVIEAHDISEILPDPNWRSRYDKPKPAPIQIPIEQPKCSRYESTPWPKTDRRLFRQRRDRTRQRLRDNLKAGGWIAAVTILEKAKSDGIPIRRLKRAKRHFFGKALGGFGWPNSQECGIDVITLTPRARNFVDFGIFQRRPVSSDQTPCHRTRRLYF